MNIISARNAARQAANTRQRNRAAPSRRQQQRNMLEDRFVYESRLNKEEHERTLEMERKRQAAELMKAYALGGGTLTPEVAKQIQGYVGTGSGESKDSTPQGVYVPGVGRVSPQRAAWYARNRAYWQQKQQQQGRNPKIVGGPPKRRRARIVGPDGQEYEFHGDDTAISDPDVEKSREGLDTLKRFKMDMARKNAIRDQRIEREMEAERQPQAPETPDADPMEMTEAEKEQIRNIMLGASGGMDREPDPSKPYYGLRPAGRGGLTQEQYDAVADMNEADLSHLTDYMTPETLGDMDPGLLQREREASRRALEAMFGANGYGTPRQADAPAEAMGAPQQAESQLPVEPEPLSPLTPDGDLAPWMRRKIAADIARHRIREEDADALQSPAHGGTMPYRDYQRMLQAAQRAPGQIDITPQGGWGQAIGAAQQMFPTILAESGQGLQNPVGGGYTVAERDRMLRENQPQAPALPAQPPAQPDTGSEGIRIRNPQQQRTDLEERKLGMQEDLINIQKDQAQRELEEQERQEALTYIEPVMKQLESLPMPGTGDGPFKPDEGTGEAYQTAAARIRNAIETAPPEQREMIRKHMRRTLPWYPKAKTILAEIKALTKWSGQEITRQTQKHGRIPDDVMDAIKERNREKYREFADKYFGGGMFPGRMFNNNIGQQIGILRDGLSSVVQALEHTPEQ